MDGPPRGDTLVVFFSGDGGWARFDRRIAAALVACGVPVVGWSAFRYLWAARTPESIAADLGSVMTHYRPRWQAARVVLAGFSRGADLLPFAFNRLPPALAEAVTALVLIGVTAEAGFQYRVVDWLGLGRFFGPPPGLVRIAPEIGRLPADRTWVVNGAEDHMAVAEAELSAVGIPAEIWPGGHHLGYACQAVAERIVARIDATSGDRVTI